MLELTEDAYTVIVEHARECEPREACGILGGTYGKQRSFADVVYPCKNASPVPEQQYEIAPEVQFELITEIEQRDRDIVGFYHSHPRGPDQPSETDEKLATWDGYSYVIAILDGNNVDVGSWRWNGERFEREEVNVG